MQRQPPVEDRQIAAWLIAKVAEYASIPEDQVEIEAPLADYGLSSKQAVGMAGELGDWLELDIPPTIVWEYPTIVALASHLAASMPSRDVGGPVAWDP